MADDTERLPGGTVSTWCERCALQFPALALLASEFLHADWPDEYEDVGDAVHAFATERPGLAARLPHEVDNLLAEMLSDEQLEDMLVEHLGLAYRPKGRVTYARWLEDVALKVHGLMARP
jgi:CdiI immunity protein